MLNSWGQGGGLNAGLGFWLPLDDLGAGAVNTTPVVASGSPTATFTRATTATTVLSNGLVGSVASGIARSCYSPAGVYLGYLAEEQRTNYVFPSNDFSSANFTKRNGHVVTSTNNAAPDGTNTASLITVTAGSPGTNQGIFIEENGNGNGSYAFALYLKAGTITSVNMVVKDRATDTVRATTVASLTSAWTKFVVVGTTAGVSTGFRVEFEGESANGTFLAWGIDTQAGAFSTSYIPTTTASVTRNADSLTYPVSGNALGTGGAAYAEVTTISGANRYVLDLNSAANSPPLYYSNGASKLSIYDGTTESLDSSWTPSASVPAKVASTWGGSTKKTAIGGVVGAGSAFDGDMNVGTNILVGNGNTSNAPLNGTIRNVRIWTRALADSQLISLTS